MQHSEVGRHRSVTLMRTGKLAAPVGSPLGHSTSTGMDGFHWRAPIEVTSAVAGIVMGRHVNMLITCASLPRSRPRQSAYNPMSALQNTASPPFVTWRAALPPFSRDGPSHGALPPLCSRAGPLERVQFCGALHVWTTHAAPVNAAGRRAGRLLQCQVRQGTGGRRDAILHVRRPSFRPRAGPAAGRATTEQHATS